MPIVLIIIIGLIILFLIAARIFNFDLREITEFIKDFSWYIIAGIFLILLFTFVVSFQPIAGNSMAPTLEEGDIIVFSKLPTNKYERNNIIAMKDNKQKSMVKRIIGLPGEKIEYKDNKLYINDEIVEEVFLDKDIETYNFKFSDICPQEACPNNIIPYDMYLVLGDNRPDSEDSRAYGLGYKIYHYDRVLVDGQPYIGIDFGPFWIEDKSKLF